MSSFARVLIFIQACLLKNSLSQQLYSGGAVTSGGYGTILNTGYGSAGLDGFSVGGANIGGAAIGGNSFVENGYGATAIGSSGAFNTGAVNAGIVGTSYDGLISGSTYPATYGGYGTGNVAAFGQLPVAGNTYINGQVPVIGAVTFNGDIPAAGSVSVSGTCGCSCDFPQIYY